MIYLSLMTKGILLLQMGGPASSYGVEGFLNNLFNDPYIIQLPGFLKPFQKNLAAYIARERAPSVAKNYEMIGGKSPILFETQCQAKALEKRLGGEYQCYIAMRYSSPFLKETLPQMKIDGIDDLTVIPLYPHYSTATSGSSIIECLEIFSETGFDQKAKIRYVESWHDNPFFIELLTRRLVDAIGDLQEAHILFSAHGLPVKYITNGDPYQQQIEASIALICQRLADTLNLKIYPNKLVSDHLILNYSISYQSRVGPVKWLEPNTEDQIKELGDNGCKNLIIVPISFVGDHIETLHELGIEYKEVAAQSGIIDYRITRLPKANPLLIEALASVIASKVKQSCLCIDSSDSWIASSPPAPRNDEKLHR